MLKGGRKTNRSLTKQDCYVRRGLYELFDHFVRYFRDLGMFFLMQQPAQYLILVHEIACGKYSWKNFLNCDYVLYL